MSNDLIGTGIAVTLHQLVHEVDGFAEQILRDNYGISYSQYHFLAAASTMDGSDVTTLAECLGVSKAAVSKRLDGLAADGLISLGSDPAHARRVLVHLTPRAAALVVEATALLEREFSAALGELAPGDIAELHTRLRVVLDIFLRKHEESAG